VSKPWEGPLTQVDFEHAGLPCKLKRHPRTLTWCGYVGVEPDEARRLIGQVVPSDLDVHWGITWTGPLPWTGRSRLFWFGFDCAHGGDLIPGVINELRKTGPLGESLAQDMEDEDVYRTVGYARAQCRKLAEQLAQALKGAT
jgi:hypothetical protein